MRHWVSKVYANRALDHWVMRITRFGHPPMPWFVCWFPSINKEIQWLVLCINLTVLRDTDSSCNGIYACVRIYSKEIGIQNSRRRRSFMTMYTLILLTTIIYIYGPHCNLWKHIQQCVQVNFTCSAFPFHWHCFVIAVLQLHFSTWPWNI